MCGRYKLKADWQEYCENPFFDWDNPPFSTPNPFAGSEEVFPRNRMPIIRHYEDGKLRPDMRQWGFIVMVNGKSIDPASGKPKKVSKDVFNAMSEKLTTSFTWRFAFKERRCLLRTQIKWTNYGIYAAARFPRFLFASRRCIFTRRPVLDPEPPIAMM